VAKSRDFGGFKTRMKKRASNIIKNADQLVRRCALATDGAVVLATPVDTGRARGNWQMEVNTPFVGETGRLSTSGQESIEQAKAKAAQYKGGTPHAALYITNNVPYIGKLNEGSSAQAPAGFVEQAVMVGVRAVHSAGGLVTNHTSRQE
jgi:hypothetical protein